MALLSKNQIIGAEDRKTKDVDVPEWGGQVRLVGLTGTERDAWENSIVIYGSNGQVVGRKMKGARASLLAKTLVDANGERLFTDKELNALNEKSGAVVNRLFDEARKLSGLGDEAVKEKAGNSEAAPSGASTSV